MRYVFMRLVGTRYTQIICVMLGLATFVVGQTVTTVLDNGPSSNRIDLVFIGDGYTNSDLNTTYPNHVQEELNYLFSGADRNPFPRYQNFFNAHRVNVVSNESGADQPPNNIFLDTALDASYWWGGTERCLYFDTSKANQATTTALAGTGIDIDARFGLVNDEKYGGCGGSWAVYAAGNVSAADIGVHELGHSLGNLADEYFYNGDTYTGSEPNAVNITTSPSLGKWDRWVGYDDPDTSVGPIDYYEGGGYYDFGMYRPSNNSEMRALFRPFDAISREQFIRRFYNEVDPLDGWQDNSVSLLNPPSLSVDTIDPSVIHVEWFLDNVSLGNLGETLDVESLGLGPGDYTVRARAYDAILDHSFTGDSLDWWRYSDTSDLEQSIHWDFVVNFPGDFNDDGIYNCFDIDNLTLQIATQSGDLKFDVNGDGTLDNLDVDAWLAEAGEATLASGNPFLRGDANLDGFVDASDFNIWNSSKYTNAPFWCLGDFNVDGAVDGSDFNMWNSNKFTSSDLAAVPEPTGIVLALLALLFLPRRR